MAAVLSEFHLIAGDAETVTAAQIDVTYASIPADELQRSVVIVDHIVDGMVGYGRTGADDTPEGRIQYWVAPVHPEHLNQAVFIALVRAARATSAATEPSPSPSSTTSCAVGFPIPARINRLATSR